MLEGEFIMTVKSMEKTGNSVTRCTYGSYDPDEVMKNISNSSEPDEFGSCLVISDNKQMPVYQQDISDILEIIDDEEKNKLGPRERIEYKSLNEGYKENLRELKLMSKFSKYTICTKCHTRVALSILRMNNGQCPTNYNGEECNTVLMTETFPGEWTISKDLIKCDVKPLVQKSCLVNKELDPDGSALQWLKFTDLHKAVQEELLNTLECYTTEPIVELEKLTVEPVKETVEPVKETVLTKLGNLFKEDEHASINQELNYELYNKTDSLAPNWTSPFKRLWNRFTCKRTTLRHNTPKILGGLAILGLLGLYFTNVTWWIGVSVLSVLTILISYVPFQFKVALGLGTFLAFYCLQD